MTAFLLSLGQIPAPLYALIGAAIVALITQITRRRMLATAAQIKADTDNARMTIQEAVDFRRELREEIDRLQERLRHVEKDLDEWKVNYYKLYEEKATLAVENATLKGQNHLLEDRVNRCLTLHTQ